MAKIHKETKTALEEAAGRMKKAYDKHKRSALTYKKKLDDKQVGPFKILKTGTSAYKLKLLPHWRIHPCFNKKLLTPYISPVEEEWEIEEILDSKTRKVRGKRGKPSNTVVDYFIKWKGWTREHNSWVTESEMGNAEEAIADYEARIEHNERVDVAKIATSSHALTITMVLDHDYRNDGDNPDVNLWKEYLEEYWANQADAQYNSLPEEP
ncbi:uncharacterized protein ARMOST_15271 [Armillaria ostoyae]|uniref:Chromo domain-containing protein n=1 Tax=Armillaria ostoyae TaxID=47428 RepID=A0A284RSZ6_ARMOS|nr:uncharacterized protein ARMOST_15271 [Armillaria ostoyae]